ncbi:MAG: hypothetical protein ACOY82_08110 [Pseudomonadota bacterium]
MAAVTVVNPGSESYEIAGAAEASDTDRAFTSSERVPRTRDGRLGNGAVRAREIDFSTPLNSQIGRLSIAADAGDIDAICKLVRSFDYCRGIGRMQGVEESLYEEAAALEADGQELIGGVIEEIRRSDDEIMQAQAFCSNLGVSVEYELTRRLLQAADRGDVLAMNRFVFGPPIEGSSALDMSGAMHIFRKNVHVVLKSAAFHGDIRAIQALYYAQKSGAISTDYGDVKVDRDPELIAAIAQVLIEFGDSDVRYEASEHLSSSEVGSGIMSSARSAQLREKMRKSLLRTGVRNSSNPGFGRGIPSSSCG